MVRRTPLQGGEHTRAFCSGAARPPKEERPFSRATAPTMRPGRDKVSRDHSGAARPLLRVRLTELSTRSARPALFTMSTSRCRWRGKKVQERKSKRETTFVRALRECPALAVVMCRWS